MRRRCGTVADMALEHALLVSLRERPGAGLEMARRFDRSIGFFWTATHQQIYRVLRRMEADGWVAATAVEQSGRPEKRVYSVTPAGERALADWIAEPSERGAYRSDLAVRMRGASYGDRAALLDDLTRRVADHRVRLAHYEGLAARDYPDPSRLAGQDLDLYLVLRGGILQETFWISWLTEYLEAHS